MTGIVMFWREAGPDRWFEADDAFDGVLRQQFEQTHLLAAAGRLVVDEATPDGALALVLLLDQVPRNIYRGTAHAFATDPLARRAARHALADRLDRHVEPQLRQFFYLPFEHSEDRRDQACSLRLFAAHHRQFPDEHCLHYARLHARLIRRFGRFPHRNAVLGRETTPAEQDYLDGGGFCG